MKDSHVILIAAGLALVAFIAFRSRTATVNTVPVTSSGTAGSGDQLAGTAITAGASVLNTFIDRLFTDRSQD